MPTYEYRCTQCLHTFERYQAVGDAPPECPRCGSPSRKVYASVGLIFKGSGFHTTDYRRPSSDNGDSAAGKPAAGKPEAAPAPATSTTDSKDKP
jgi:putative FmdB family regulatory protein